MNTKNGDSAAAPASDLRFAIIGAGMSGILSAIKLCEAGLTNYVIYEKAERLGGTWRENRYPGIACDVPSHAYTYSFEPNPDWSREFSPGSEIQGYFEGVAEKYAVNEHIRFAEEIDHCDFNEGRWHISTKSGLRDEVDFIIAATGVLHHPRYPDIDGLDDFEGAVFHSARWDDEISFEGKKVGIIGTGSSAVQMTAAMADHVETLSLFQRTAQWIMPQTNVVYSEEEKQDFRDSPERLHEIHADFQKLFAEGFANAVADASSPQMKGIQDICLANLEESVADVELREKLRPTYQAACKRIIFSPDFYQAVQKPSVEVVTDGIKRVEAKGVRTADGRLHELDILVLATGFRVDRFMRPMEIVGRSGKRLDEVWVDRPSAYLSISIPDFPNLFMLNGPNGPVGNFSLIQVAELQFAYILQLIELVRAGECNEVSASAAATATFDAERTEAAKSTIWATGCRSWYLDDRGIPAVWPWTYDRFKEEMAQPDLKAFDCVK